MTSFICRELGVKPADTIMVGDTPADTLMGQKAKLGLTVGVLSGVGDREDLRDADIIVGDVTHCVDMILKPRDGRVHQGWMEFIRQDCFVRVDQYSGFELGMG